MKVSDWLLNFVEDSMSFHIGVKIYPTKNTDDICKNCLVNECSESKEMEQASIKNMYGRDKR